MNERPGSWRNAWIAVSGVALFVGVWWIASAKSSPVIVPSPYATFEALEYLGESGLLLESIAVSTMRIGAGWLLGSVAGILLGLLLGVSRVARLLIIPYIEGLRYIPPIAFVTVFIIWFGTGELSKILLLFYTAVFVVTLNTMAGVASVNQGTVRAARSLGATENQVLRHVILPQTVPYIVTGLRLALTNTFITIVAAEMVAAKSGMGYLIWSSRDFLLTDQVFAGIIVIGFMGLLMDRLFHRVASATLARFGIV